MNSIFLRVYGGLLAVLVLVALLGFATLQLVNQVRVDNYRENLANGTFRLMADNLREPAQQAAESIKTGAVVVLDVPTGEVRAVYSAPADYYNRALSAYAVGSVFKLIVAAAALEADLQPIYTCKGKMGNCY